MSTNGTSIACQQQQKRIMKPNESDRTHGPTRSVVHSPQPRLRPAARSALMLGMAHRALVVDACHEIPRPHDRARLLYVRLGEGFRGKPQRNTRGSCTSACVQSLRGASHSIVRALTQANCRGEARSESPRFSCGCRRCESWHCLRTYNHATVPCGLTLLGVAVAACWCV